MKKINKKGQFLPSPQRTSGIIAWFENNPAWFIAIASIVMFLALAGIQILSCKYGNTCLKVACGAGKILWLIPDFIGIC